VCVGSVGQQKSGVENIRILSMSLLEDIVDLLRCVLEYFGVPPEMVNMIIHLV